MIKYLRAALANRLLLALVGVSLFPVIVLGVAMHFLASQALMAEASNRLEAVRTIKANQVREYFELNRNQVRTFAESRMVLQALLGFSEAFKTAREENKVTPEMLAQYRSDLRSYYTGDFAIEYGKRNQGEVIAADRLINPLDDDAAYLQALYIKRNPYPIGSKDLLEAADDQSRYTELHRQFHPVFRNYLKRYAFYDIFLVEIESGDVVYSAFKEVDFGTSLKNGPYASSNIARVFQEAAASTSEDFVAFADYEHYTPSYEEAASFMAAPIYDGEKKVGVAVFQLAISRINEIMAERAGLGETGETYMVGPDKLFRNDSRFLDELGVSTTILNKAIVVESAATRSALNEHKAGTQIIDDYRGASVLSSWTPVVVQEASRAGATPVEWALMSDVDLSQIRAPINKITRYSITIFLVAGASAFLVSFLIARRFNQEADRQASLIRGISENTQTLASASEELTSVSVQMSSAAEETNAASRCRRLGRGASQRQRPHRFRGHRTPQRQHPRNRSKHGKSSSRRKSVRCRRLSGQRDDHRIGDQQCSHRRSRQGHYVDCRANQPAGLERDDRSRAGGRGRQRIRRCR